MTVTGTHHPRVGENSKNEALIATIDGRPKRR